MNTTKPERIESVNQWLVVIASSGRQFFAHDHPQGRVVAYFLADARGRLWMLNEYSLKLMYASMQKPYRNFTHGGTLQRLCHDLVSFIRHGRTIKVSGIHWAYGDDLPEVLRQGVALGVLREAAS